MMNIVKKIKKTSNTIKEVSLTLIFIGALVGSSLSAMANAASVENIEHSITQFVTEQSDQVITDISHQLIWSIEQQINTIIESYSVEQSEVWLTNKIIATTNSTNAKKVTQNTNDSKSNTAVTVKKYD